MKRWWLVIALLLSVGINIGILATIAFQERSGGEAPGDTAPGTTVDPEPPAARFPEGDPVPPEGRLPPMIRRVADELGLEGGKRAAFLELQRTFFDQTLSARSRMARLQREIRGEVTSAEPDRDALERLLVELSAAHTDLERAFVYNLLAAREILDGEQERRYMHFLHRMRHVRRDVEQRFRERWRDSGERWERGGPGFDRPGRDRPRGRRGPGRRFEPPPESPPDAGR